jgi:DNA polymerase-3 subunit delta'
MLTQYGGLEIAEAIDRIARTAQLDVPAAHRLADVVSGRDQSIQFDIFNRHALDLLSGEASAAALAGDAPKGDLLSESWRELQTATTEAETYNLDRKQHVLNTLVRLNGILRS